MSAGKLAWGTAWIRKRCAWCDGMITAPKASGRVYCGEYCYRATVREDDRKQREQHGRDYGPGLILHATHPDTLAYIDAVQRERPSYQSWRDAR